eukprot:COSAG01_NODE_392_length_17668_cov_5.382264_18_plen_70_part_00
MFLNYFLCSAMPVRILMTRSRYEMDVDGTLRPAGWTEKLELLHADALAEVQRYAGDAGSLEAVFGMVKQ